MWAKQFSANLRWLKQIFVSAIFFGGIITILLLGVKWERIFYPGGFVSNEKEIKFTNLKTEVVLTTDEKVFLQKIENLLTKRGYIINSIAINQNRDVTLNTNIGNILFSLSQNNDNIVNTLITLLDDNTLVGDLKIDTNMLEYIDIRFGNKVFYKLKSQNEERVLATSTTEGN